MKIIKGDLIHFAEQGVFDLIVHGSNCFCKMGAGIAKSIKQHFPDAYEADLTTKKGDKRKLGTWTIGHIDLDSGDELLVMNGYTQYDYRGKGPHADYNAIKSVFNGIKVFYPCLKIGYPKIGAGLAGGDWSRISKIIDEQLEGMDHTLVEFKK